MTAPLFALPTSSTGAALITAAQGHVAQLRDAGVLGPGHELQAAIVQDLADSIVRAPGYAKAQLIKELHQALDRLPSPALSDGWDTWANLARALHRPASPVAPATYATRPTPGAAHEADGVAMVAALLGKPLMPWQHQVLRVATERTPDGSRWKYRRVVVTVPRQSGKTTLLGALYVHRALTRLNARVWMTAQTGKDATARWNDLRKLVTSSLLEPYTHARLSAGSASLEFPRSESFINPFAPTPQSLHGYTFDNVAIDEAFAFTMDEGRDLLGASEPAMITLPDHQTWITSTAGGPESTWLRSLVEHGRTATSVAYFEWSGDIGDDPTSLDTYRFHPAIGHTVTVEDVRDLAIELPPTERDRAFRNLWTDTVGEPLLPLAELRSCYEAATPPPPVDGTVPVAIGFDVDADGSWSSIYTAWPDRSDQVLTAKLASRDGMAWLVAELRDALDAAGPAAELVTPPDGPSLETVAELDRLGIPVRILDGRTYATATGSLHRAIRRRELPIAGPDADLEAAINGAATRPMGDSWVVSRSRSTANVSAWGALAAAKRVIDEDGIAELPIIEGES